MKKKKQKKLTHTKTKQKNIRPVHDLSWSASGVIANIKIVYARWWDVGLYQ